ncbi:PREDICTED: lymphoid-specific helicase-like [Vollenhovia emeryi]|uniref:lymphoid-specific helicase-like n=1 Tax=Vollenhovia emeryi TaxID=411798 RepID=UPI0005F3F165|nr:PREDICTED: lymphoid-specific helicase-like [Vollenhovia emeryi]
MDRSADDNANTIDPNVELGSYSSALGDILPLASDVKFNNNPLEQESKKAKSNRGRKKLREEYDNEYDHEAQEQRYERLKRLLNKSKNSSYSKNKTNKIKDEGEKKRDANKTNCPVNDENVPPAKKRALRKANVKKYNVQEYMSTEIKEQEKIAKRKTKLSVEEVEAELSADSDVEADPKPAAGSTAVTPRYFCGELRDYQHTGLEWLMGLYENDLSGILADEMGLGKTIQIIALLCYLVEKRQQGPYLIIAPLSTIPNWLAEFERFAPAIPVLLLYGTIDERRTIREKFNWPKYVEGHKMQPVMIATYEVCLHEKNFLHSQKWRYIIVDEGQRIKNYNCHLFKLLKNLRSTNRLILTGTPLQNNLSELWSLLNFLLPKIFDDLDTFESWVDVKDLQQQDSAEKLLKQEKDKRVLTLLREIVKPYMLRRLKSDVCLEIPPKKELVVYAPLTEIQYDLYKAVLNFDHEMLTKIEVPDLIIPTVDGKRPKRLCVLRKYGSIANESETEKQNISSQVANTKDENLSKWKQYTDVTERNRDFLINIQFINRAVMYKKIVNHPYLVHCPRDSTGLPKIDIDLIKSSGKLLVLDAMLAKLKEQGHKVLLFSTMTKILDVIEDYLMLRDHNYVRLDGMTKIEDRQKNISIFNNDPDMFLFLISIRAGGIGLNLMAADTVIIYDSDWNPQVDIQAMARCHRIGQTRPVVIYKLCTKGTIDEMIMKRAEAKRILEKIVMSESFNKITILEMKKLIDTKEYKVVTSEKEVFTEMELNKLLDRSDMMNNHDPSNSQG